MKFLFASDSFKGTLSSEKTGELLTRAAAQIFPEAECSCVFVADGGEGTTEAVIRETDGEKIHLSVTGPLGAATEAFYGRIDGKKAVLEMAQASGLLLISREERNPEKTTTYGTGEMIKDALSRGFTDISIAIGGSATNDGGMGCMEALGVRFLDKEGKSLRGRGENLEKIASIDLTGLDRRIKDARFTVMCDVTNPLCGKDGATYTFGAQKGGTPQMLDRLERGMENYRNILLSSFGVNVDEIPGSGAAGGLGAALCVFLKGEMKSGIDTVLDLIQFDKRLEGVSLVVTGEGRADWQSCFGKVMEGVGMRCKCHKIPAVALVGSMGQGAENIFQYGICSMMTTVNGIMPLEEALEKAEELYYEGAVRLFRMLQAGMRLSG
ncbi:MAG TPA: glycerate kinase [Candidatus Hungatella pullicola]|nr:glycerate kinase [Candidatus Hungatella pullicola]